MSVRLAGAAFVAMLLMASAAAAQPRGTAANASAPPANNTPSALQGFQQNKGQPVKIEAARLEVRDKQKIATFSGNVKVVQGDTTMRCRTLVVYYDSKQDGGAKAQPMPAEQPGPGGASQITRLEAKGNVIVTQKDQTATGDNAVFDMKANTVTLMNNVTVSQGPNVVQGERLVVDLTTGVSTVDAGASRGPVRMMIQNGTLQPQPGGAAPSQPRFGSQRGNSPN